MTDCKNFQVIQPLGILKGWSSSLSDSLWDLSIAMLARHSDYLVASRDRNLDKAVRQMYLERSFELEMYAACLMYLVSQINPIVYKQNKVGLTEMFIRHGLEPLDFLK